MRRDNPGVAILGDVCNDHNRINGISTQGWGSASLFVSSYLQRHSIHPQVFAPYAQDLQVPAGSFDFKWTRQSGVESLRFENVIDRAVRTQWCPTLGPRWPEALAEVDIEAIRASDILIWCPLVPPSITFHRGIFQPAMAAFRDESRHELKLSIGIVQGMGRLNCGIPAKAIAHSSIPQANPYWPECDVVIFSEEDFLDAHLGAERWSKSWPDKFVVVTQAASGARLYFDGSWADFETTPIRAGMENNSIGVGDIFAASLALLYFQALRRSPPLRRRDPEVLGAAISSANQAAYTFMLQPPEATPPDSLSAQLANRPCSATDSGPHSSGEASHGPQLSCNDGSLGGV